MKGTSGKNIFLPKHITGKEKKPKHVRKMIHICISISAVQPNLIFTHQNSALPRYKTSVPSWISKLFPFSQYIHIHTHSSIILSLKKLAFLEEKPFYEWTLPLIPIFIQEQSNMATILILHGLKVYLNLLKDQMEINLLLNRKYPCSSKDFLHFGNTWLQITMELFHA